MVTGPDSLRSVPRDPEATERRAWIWHILFAASLGIPTGLAATDASTGLGTRTATVAVAALWSAAYLVAVRRHDAFDDLAPRKVFRRRGGEGRDERREEQR